MTLLVAFLLTTYSEAQQHYRGAIANLSPYDSSYLYNLYTLEKSFALLCKADEDYVYWSLVSELISSAWNLFVDMQGRVELWLKFSNSDIYGISKPSFIQYLGPIEIICNGFQDDALVDALQRLNPTKEKSYCKDRIVKLISYDYPHKLGFKQEFFANDYPGVDFYNEILNIYGNDFDKIFPSKAFVIASDVVNDFLKDIVSN